MNSIIVRDDISIAYRNSAGIAQLKKNIVGLVAATVRGSPDLKRTCDQILRGYADQAEKGLGL